MRISTGMLYELGVASVQQRQENLLRLQQQLATGQRILVPSDDPGASAAVLDIRQSQALNSQYQANCDTAKAQLAMEEGVLGSVTSVLQDIKTLAVYGGNATLSNTDRSALAAELKSRYDELLALANHEDGNGHYLFSGYQEKTQPFVEASPGQVAYAGDDGQRNIRIDANRVIPVSDSGRAVFTDIRTGNGIFTASPNAANTGGGMISPGIVTDPLSWKAANSRDFSVRFHVDAGVPPKTTYDIVDNVNNISLLTGVAPVTGPHLREYVPGAAISLATQSPPDTTASPFDAGAVVSVEGEPASGDSFSIKPSTNQDVFTTIYNLIVALRNGTSASTGSVATYQNTLNASMLGVDNAIEKVLTVRADLGARLKAVEGAQGASEDIALQYSNRLAGLQDLDYAKAISDLNLQQTQLDAAQKSFLKVTSLNLFSLL